MGNDTIASMITSIRNANLRRTLLKRSSKFINLSQQTERNVDSNLRYNTSLL